ncbi:retrotransposon protein, putative, ty1-copia subclass [Tanacetum coccineum]|uniref:Retrotransposon protein, putative, ty1-copia subclass n=1 Tax=Tanacetum coccineum TaxID=301880 RepID=A0ABQ5FWC7_9ASTR
MKIKESLNVTFDGTLPPSKASPLVDDDLDEEEEAIKVTKKKNPKNDIEDETLEFDEIVNIKESKNHQLGNVIGNLNQRTLRLFIPTSGIKALVRELSGCLGSIKKVFLGDSFVLEGVDLVAGVFGFVGFLDKEHYQVSLKLQDLFDSWFKEDEHVLVFLGLCKVEDKEEEDTVEAAIKKFTPVNRFSKSTKEKRMTRAKFDIEKFDETGDFELCRIKMRSLLIQHGCEAALEALPTDMEAQMKAKEALTLEDVMPTLNSKEIKKRSKAKGDDGEGLYDQLKRNCPNNNRKKLTGYVKKDDQPSSSGLTYDDSEVMTVEALLDWIMDSGCSYHMTPKLDIFFDFLECDRGSVLLGDNRECKNRGIGKVRVQLKDVRYIPELKRNLISLGTLEKEGYIVKLHSGKVKVINGSRVVLSRTRRDNCVYSLDGQAVASELNASVKEKDSLAQVWQKKLRHISEAGLHVLEKQGLFGKKSLDLWGPFQVESLGGKRYFLSIVNDYSRRVWVYILRFKHEAFGKFKEWKQLVESQTGRTVKKLRTDNGLEFCNQEFEQLCIESEIVRHSTVARMPQQNGLLERMNRTLMDKIRYLLIQSGLLKTFWTEGTCTDAYLINRSPSTAIEKKTPMEMWSGHPSDYGMLRIFGCVAYSYVKQGKLKPRAVKCVLLGYPNGVKGYRLYRLDDESPNIVTSENVVFNESVMYKDTLKDSGADQEDGDDEDAGDQETEQTPDLIDYQLVRDRESIACEDSSKWKAAMKEEMDSLRKNKTWELVDHPVGQKLRVGIDYNEVFSPVARHTPIRVILALTVCKDYELEQLDVKTAFLHGNLKEVIYMRRFDGYMLSNGFKRSSRQLRILQELCTSKAEIGSTKSLLKKEFDMKELGEAKKILGMEIIRDRSCKILRLSLKDFLVRDYDVERMSKVSYANAVGSLMYLMVCMRADIAYVVSVVSRYLANPGFVDSDYAKDPDKRRSIIGCAFLVHGCVVSWKAMLQHVVALSTTKAEYMALTEAVKEAI